MKNEALYALEELVIANHGRPARPSDEPNKLRREALTRALGVLGDPESATVNSALNASRSILSAFRGLGTGDAVQETAKRGVERLLVRFRKSND